MYNTVIFDLDGTLTYTLQDIADAMNRALRLHGLTEHPVDAYRKMVGNGARKLAERAVGEHTELLDAVFADYQAWYETHACVTTSPYDGMPETLKALQAAGIRLCVLSNKPHADTVNVVRGYFPEIEWSVIRGQMPGQPVKPNPSGALNIVDSLCVSPRNCLYVGDSDVDMQTGKAAGMDAAGAVWGYRDAEELASNGARYLVNKPVDLIAIVLNDKL